MSFVGASAIDCGVHPSVPVTPVGSPSTCSEDYAAQAVVYPRLAESVPA